ncbi:amidohydrolase family protein [[Clostridium] symbiosum]|uniref:amidohydrolase family protein n=1 Tax=Clostridium symbiosum TaxID=1512 RepID=UPI001D063971|nr:amidohydrolase family protein [[Clostridium] symbiosum]MCB6611514.1 amidohydrolase family protein [[Clostridium] symbiosum]MCB6932915.1 amidohydrolase family protein [[Clostridium] symbiosum]
MKADIIIKNGHIFDPAAGIDMHGNVIINKKQIVKLTETITEGEYEAVREIDAGGRMVIPGLIDAHTHINYLGQANGAPADLLCIPNGVTAAIDAGSTGVSNYKGLLHCLSQHEIKTKIMLNVSAGGIIMPTWYPEPLDPECWDTDWFDEAFENFRREIIGLKIRVSRNVLGSLGVKPLEAALKLAERYNTRVIVHLTDPILPIGALADMMRSGDILTHIHHGKGETILKNGTIDKRVLDAQKRGVIMDCANGKFNISLEVARRAIEEKFFPDSISSDLNISNWCSPWVFSLPIVMSKYLALGMTVKQIVERVTAAPALQMGEEKNLGTLREGTSADITILELIEKKTEFKDIFGGSICGTQLFMPRAAILDGKIRFLSSEMYA